MLADLYVVRGLVMESGPKDYGTRATIQADIQNAAPERSPRKDSLFARRLDARKVVYNR